eukprot:2347045-Amphidinium_carterae.1
MQGIGGFFTRMKSQSNWRFLGCSQRAGRIVWNPFGLDALSLKCQGEKDPDNIHKPGYSLGDGLLLVPASCLILFYVMYDCCVQNWVLNQTIRSLRINKVRSSFTRHRESTRSSIKHNKIINVL